MCGITGFIDLRRGTPNDALRATAQRMADTLRHRGPDDAGVWVDAAAGIALGHRRLSILDVSAAGHQPMISESGRYVITYNGEIYNFQELRHELEGSSRQRPTFSGHSDTEVLLACFDRWGVEASLPRLNGMFAFAVWDRQEHALHLCRDRMGEKPLYYGWMANVFLFGSELKALRACPEFRAEVNRDALALYLRHNCIPAPHSIYQGIYKLLPGRYLRLAGDTRMGTAPVPYWSLKEAVERGVGEPFRCTEQEATKQLETLLRDAVKIRMVSDVPLGTFLSGGVDSSTVTALMQSQSARPIRTFSIGVCDIEYNEAVDAAAVARHLGTQHTELYVNPAEAMAVIPKLPTMYDEPFADSSQIPTFLISQLARRDVTVGLSGDGGDEIFGGYNRHVWSDQLWKTIGWIPRSARRVAAAALTSFRVQSWESFFRMVDPILPAKMKHRTPGYKLHKLAGVLGLQDRAAMYFGLVSHWIDPASVVIGGREPATALNTSGAWKIQPSSIQEMMFLDAVTYLPDDILTKVDRASMAVSLEARVPFLDHRVVEFASRIPVSMKIRNAQGKWLLRQVLYRHVPRELVDRPKSGFGIPLAAWLRGPLRDWAQSLLDERRLRDDGFFHPQPIREKWEEHISGKMNWQYHIWDVLMFQAWLESSRQPQSQVETSAVGVS